MMTLSKYLEGKDIEEFARKIGVTSTSVRRYISEDRTPKRPIMNKIYEATEQQVTADSFYLQDTAK